jgi:hypothetical protein
MQYCSSGDDVSLEPDCFSRGNTSRSHRSQSAMMSARTTDELKEMAAKRKSANFMPLLFKPPERRGEHQVDNIAPVSLKILSGADTAEFETRMRPLRIDSGTIDCPAVLRKFSGEGIKRELKGKVAAGVLEVLKRNALQ